jgi:hypothetical protein
MRITKLALCLLGFAALALPVLHPQDISGPPVPGVTHPQDISGPPVPGVVAHPQDISGPPVPGVTAAI